MNINRTLFKLDHYSDRSENLHELLARTNFPAIRLKDSNDN